MNYNIENIPLVAFTRNGFLEGLHRGSFAIAASNGKLIASSGDYSQLALLRSCAKPFQLISVLKSGAVEKYGFTDGELAVAAASHSGEAEHLRKVRSMMEKMGLPLSSLRCGSHPALFPHIAIAMAKENAEPSPIRNNCSGKHASMLAVCETMDWDKHNYERIDHPLQIENRRIIAAFTGKKPEEIGYGIDGCTVPTFALSLLDAAIAFAKIADPSYAPDGMQGFAARVFNIMNAYPSLGSGKVGRLEAKLMELFPGKLIAKVGAEGYFALALAPGLLGENGIGLALKLEDGITFNRASDIVVISILEQLDLLSNDKLSNLKGFYPKDIFDCRGAVVGDIRVLFKI